MDKLDEIFYIQDKLNSFIREKWKLDHAPEVWIQKQTLALLCELSEVLEEINYKWWKGPKEIDKGALKEELADVFHFFVSMCLSADMSAQELYDVYMSKNKENFDRQNGLSNKKGYCLTDDGEVRNE